MLTVCNFTYVLGGWYYKLILSSERCRRMTMIQRCSICCCGLGLFWVFTVFRNGCVFSVDYPKSFLESSEGVASLHPLHMWRHWEAEMLSEWSKGAQPINVRVFFMLFVQNICFFVDNCSLSNLVSKWKWGCVYLTASQWSKFVIFYFILFFPSLFISSSTSLSPAAPTQADIKESVFNLNPVEQGGSQIT